MDSRRSYLSNYLKIYLWQFLSIATGFLSMFVVMPHLSSRPAMFGIYSVCMSINIFLAYADLGFMSSGFKHASESFVKGDLKRETQIVGFVSFVLLVFVILNAVAVSVIALNPTLLIENLTDPEEYRTASLLLWLVAVFSPVLVLQRMAQIVFGIRLEDYIYQRINIVGNVLKVAVVPLFFDSEGYNIVGYFLTAQIIGSVCSAASLFLARRRYRYDLLLLARSLKFSKDVYTATKRLAFSSLYVTIAWVIYHELDSLFISHTLGASALAFYAVALALSTFFRTLSSIIFAPFRARINHFAGLGEPQRLRSLYRNVLVVTLPAVLFPVISVVVLMKPFMLSWVGENYLPSVLIAQLLMLSYLDGFSRHPATFLLAAQERVRELNIIGSLPPILFWAAVLLSLRVLDVTLFGLLKLLAGVPVQLFALIISVRYLQVTASEFFWGVVAPVILPSLFLAGVLMVVRGFMPIEKSLVNVGIVICAGACASTLSILGYYLGSSEFRMTTRTVWSGLFSRKVVKEAL